MDKYTSISDVIQPELFTEYVQEKTAEKSEIMFAGVVENNPQLNKLVTGGGTVLTMPKWNDLSGKSQVFTESKDIEVSGITTHPELATVLMRANAWGSHDLAGALAGDDPMQRIAGLVADWWVRDEKNNILSILKGVCSSTTMADHVYGASAPKAISGSEVLNAKQLMGDASDLLTMIYMHSATFTELQKQNVIQFIPVAESKIQIPTYLGYRVICDDSCPVNYDSDRTTIKSYNTFLLARGAIQRGSGIPVSFVPTETDRDSLGSKDVLINRQAKVLHPKGISWIGASNITAETPSDEELATGTNWKLVAESKKVGIVKMVHTLA